MFEIKRRLKNQSTVLSWVVSFSEEERILISWAKNQGDWWENPKTNKQSFLWFCRHVGVISDNFILAFGRLSISFLKNRKDVERIEGVDPTHVRVYFKNGDSKIMSYKELKQ